MSESEGLARLTEYLKQTRRQAEIAIDNLTSQVNKLTIENDELRQSVQRLEYEKKELRDLIDQIKKDGTVKSKFKERDEWRNLVDNMQQDRTRLQEENNELSSILANASQQIEELKAELSKVLYEKAELEQRGQHVGSPSKLKSETLSPKSYDIGSLFYEDNAKTDIPSPSPMIDRSSGGSMFTFDSSSPQTTARTLRDELSRTLSQVISTIDSCGRLLESYLIYLSSLILF
jgi:prefoldin subunit 5